MATPLRSASRSFSAGSSVPSRWTCSSDLGRPVTNWRVGVDGSVIVAWTLRRRLVEVLQQVVGGQFDSLVTPFRCAVDAGDQAGAVDAAEVAVHEGVARLGLVGCPLGETEVPQRVVVPAVRLEEAVLVLGARLHL